MFNCQFLIPNRAHLQREKQMREEAERTKKELQDRLKMFESEMEMQRKGKPAD